MTLEKTLERIASALEAIAENTKAAPAPVATAAPAPKPEPAAAPKPKAAPKPAPAAPTVDVPFTDTASLNQYVMGVYTEMGAEKGAKIANVLTSMGIQNIKEISPDRYVEFYQGVEALKAS